MTMPRFFFWTAVSGRTSAARAGAAPNSAATNIRLAKQTASMLVSVIKIGQASAAPLRAMPWQGAASCRPILKPALSLPGDLRHADSGHRTSHGGSRLKISLSWRAYSLLHSIKGDCDAAYNTPSPSRVRPAAAGAALDHRAGDRRARRHQPDRRAVRARPL